jgi:hypothetical protein
LGLSVRYNCDTRGVARLTNVVLVDIGVNESKLSLVLGVLNRSLDDLVHRSDSGTTSDHEKMGGEVLAVVRPGVEIRCEVSSDLRHNTTMLRTRT